MTAAAAGLSRTKARDLRRHRQFEGSVRSASVLLLMALLVFSAQSTPVGRVSSIQSMKIPRWDRLLQSTPMKLKSTFHPLGLSFNWDTFDKSAASSAAADLKDGGNTLDVDAVVAASKKAASKVSKYLNSYFKVFAPEEFKLKGQKCNEGRYSLPDMNVKGSVDFLVYVNYVSNKDDPNIVTSLNCLQDSETKRPIAGVLNLNLQKVADISARGQDFLFRRVMHEVFHMLGFSYFSFSNQFAFAVGGNGGLSSQLTGLKGSEAVLEYAKKFFQCPALESLPVFKEEAIDNGISYGSHWSFVHFPQEIMTASPEIDSRISQFTLKALSNLGWYQIEENAGELYNEGKLETCDGISMTACPKGKMFCDQNHAGPLCSDDRKTKLECTSHPFFGKPTQDLECFYKKHIGKSCLDTSLEGSSLKGTEVFNIKESRCFEAQTINPDKPGETDDATLCLKVSSCNLTPAGVYTLIIESSDGRLFDNCRYDSVGKLTGGEDFALSTQVTIDCPTTLEGLYDLCPRSLDATNQPVYDTTAASCPENCTDESNGICMENYNCFCFFGKNDKTAGCLAPSDPPSTGSISQIPTNTLIILLCTFIPTLHVLFN